MHRPKSVGLGRDAAVYGGLRGLEIAATLAIAIPSGAMGLRGSG